jgi:hypothetical protein
VVKGVRYFITLSISVISSRSMTGDASAKRIPEASILNSDMYHVRDHNILILIVFRELYIIGEWFRLKSLITH